jgi:hypothetical protein
MGQVWRPNLGISVVVRARSKDRSYGRDMPRRSLFTVFLAVVLVLTTSANPQASEIGHSTSASPKSFSVKMDGRAPAAGAHRSSH